MLVFRLTHAMEGLVEKHLKGLIHQISLQFGQKIGLACKNFQTLQNLTTSSQNYICILFELKCLTYFF